MKNIFIVGPVASGKNTLLENIVKDNDDIIFLDTGRIFRFISYEIYNEIKDDIDIDKILNNDKEETEKIYQRLFHLTKFITSKLGQLSYNKDRMFVNNTEIDMSKFYQKNVNALLPIISKISIIRGKIIQFINSNIANSNKSIVMTGHNIKEIDTTKFCVVYLDIDEKDSTYRLYNRNIESYKNILEAYDEILKRNLNDGIKETKHILSYLYDYIYINTTGKSEQEIYYEFLKKYSENTRKNNIFLELQNNSIPRNDFKWLSNALLDPIKSLLETLTGPIVAKYPFINKNDLVYQTLIFITSHKIEELYKFNDIEYLKKVESSITLRTENLLDDFMNKVENGKITINIKLLDKDLNYMVSKLCNLYSDEKVKKVMINYNSGEKTTNLISKDGFLIKNQNGIDDNSENNITFRIIDKYMSNFISKYCHYLHSPRDDELIAYGAFIGNDKYPIAYVSFSKQDRDYKKQLLFNLGIEPQNSIEMTRAWSSNSAPQNIMSSLFQFSINDISNKWKKDCKLGITDKYLQAITTAINPNLGFKASSFLGCNFIPIALRPAKFTFELKNDNIEYKTRRKIESSIENSSFYFENRMTILPLNELILCLDKHILEKIKNSNILLIDKNDYENVLTGKILIKR